MRTTRLTIAYYMSAAIAALAAGVSAAGFFWAPLYRNATPWAAQQSRGGDLVTLFVAAPALLVAVALAWRGSVRARLVWLGLVAYMAYGYLFYLYGMPLNEAFFAYVAIVVMSIASLIIGLLELDAEKIAAAFSPKAPRKTIAGYLLFIAVFLTGMWSTRVVGFMVSGTLPPDLLASGTKAPVVFATDLALLVPALVFVAVLLLRRRAWGYVLAAVLLVKCTFYPLALIGMGTVSWLARVVADYGLMWFWAFFFVVSAGLTIWFLGNLCEETA
jgi:hypothetical protein